MINSAKNTSDIALKHLGNVLYMLSCLHPDEQCDAYKEALAFYNHHAPDKRIEPQEGYITRIVTERPLDRLLQLESGKADGRK